MPGKNSTPRIAYARTSTGLGPLTQIVEGEPWDANDPVVVGHPELFQDSPVIKVKTSTRGWVRLDEL